MNENTTPNPIEQQVRMGFWDFCHKHPMVVLFAIIFSAWGAAAIAQAISGNYPPDDGFWKYHAGCNQQ